MKKDCLKEVISKLNLKNKEKSARERTGKGIPIRWNRLCKASDSRGSSVQGAEYKPAWVCIQAGEWEGRLLIHFPSIYLEPA